MGRLELAVLTKQLGAFAIQTLKAFRANQGLLLAGGVAYYALLSIVPLLILTVIGLSYVIDQAELLDTLARYLEWLIPGQSGVVVAELANFVNHREVIGWLLLATMIFFSSLAFTVLENAMSVIFIHRVAIRRRHFLVSALIPYCYILFLGAGVLLVTLVSGSLQAMGRESVDFLGAQLAPRRRFWRASLSARIRRRNLRYHIRLLGHAGWQAIAAACADWRRHGSTALGANPPCARVVLYHAVTDWSGLRFVDDGNRGTAELGSRGDIAVAGCPGHLGIRAHRQSQPGGAAPAITHTIIGVNCKKIGN